MAIVATRLSRQLVDGQHPSESRLDAGQDSRFAFNDRHPLDRDTDPVVIDRETRVQRCQNLECVDRDLLRGSSRHHRHRYLAAAVVVGASSSAVSSVVNASSSRLGLERAPRRAGPDLDLQCELGSARSSISSRRACIRPSRKRVLKLGLQFGIDGEDQAPTSGWWPAHQRERKDLALGVDLILNEALGPTEHGVIGALQRLPCRARRCP